MDTAQTTILKRATRQDLRTSLLMGVDFVPVRQIAAMRGGASSRTTAPPAPLSAPRPVEAGDRAARLEALRLRHERECPHCTAVTGYTNLVFGEGDPEAVLMFIGEAPGEQEDETGRPFVGRAGQKLEEIIKAMSLSREKVYIANILKARPPNNRTPMPDEVARCSPFLAEQIRIIDPKVIVALGGPAAKMLLETREGITRIRGQWGAYRDPETGAETAVMPTFHPAYLLRNYTPDTRRKVWSDIQAVMEKLGLR